MNWEIDFLLALQNLRHPILDKLMIFVSTLGNAGVLWIAFAVILLFSKKYRMTGLQTLVAMALTFIVGNLILKNLIARERPFVLYETIELLIKKPGEYSFPSGHTMNGFTAAVTLLLCDKRLGIPAIVLAAVIAFSRMYLFVHFPTDIIGGILVGTLCAVVVNAIFVKKRFKNP